MFDPPQTVSQQLNIKHLENRNLKFPSGQVEQEIETNSPIMKESQNKSIVG